MKLIVESGATKSTWVLLDRGEIYDKKVLEGINPTSNPTSVKYVDRFDSRGKDQVKEVHFYGAGVSSPVAIDLLSGSIRKNFDCDIINLEHDILAAARSVSDGSPSIVSILGTGTNTVVYDGSQIVKSFKALGYLFGDYGSGFHIGKELLKAYFTGAMSLADEERFAERHVRGQDDLLFRIYDSERPNFETAKLSRFLEIASAELKDKILNHCFESFFHNQIMHISECSELPLRFVGSIAAVFRDELTKCAVKHGLNIDVIEGNPIDGLIAYHNKN